MIAKMILIAIKGFREMKKEMEEEKYKFN